MQIRTNNLTLCDNSKLIFRIIYAQLDQMYLWIE